MIFHVLNKGLLSFFMLELATHRSNDVSPCVPFCYRSFGLFARCANPCYSYKTKNPAMPSKAVVTVGKALAKSPIDPSRFPIT